MSFRGKSKIVLQVQEFLLKSGYRFTESFHRMNPVYHGFRERKKPERLCPGQGKNFPVFGFGADAIGESAEFLERDAGNEPIEGNYPQFPIGVKQIVDKNERAVLPIDDESAENHPFAALLEAWNEAISFPASADTQQLLIENSPIGDPGGDCVESGQDAFVDFVFGIRSHGNPPSFEEQCGIGILFSFHRKIKH